MFFEDGIKISYQDDYVKCIFSSELTVEHKKNLLHYDENSINKTNNALKKLGKIWEN